MRKRFDMLFWMFDRTGNENVLCITLTNYISACQAGCMVH